MSNQLGISLGRQSSMFLRITGPWADVSIWRKDFGMSHEAGPFRQLSSLKSDTYGSVCGGKHADLANIHQIVIASVRSKCMQMYSNKPIGNANRPLIVAKQPARQKNTSCRKRLSVIRGYPTSALTARAV